MLPKPKSEISSAIALLYLPTLIKTRIKQELLENSNLHTIGPLPNGVFARYTGITCAAGSLHTMIKTKSVFSPIQPSKDGLRILATRFRGRGLPATRYHIWMANLGPSEGLLRAVLKGTITWTQFDRRYRKELFEAGTIDRRNPTIKNHGQKFTLRLLQKLAKRGTVTLMCHCAEDEPRCHRHILRRILTGKI